MSLLEGNCPRCGMGEIVDDDDRGLAVCDQCGISMCLRCGGVKYRRGEEISLGPCQCQIRAVDDAYRAGAEPADAPEDEPADEPEDESEDESEDEVEVDGFPADGIEGFDDLPEDDDEDDPMGEEDGPPGHDDPAGA